MFATDKFRLRQSVGIVTTNELVEFFRANVRTIYALKMRSDNIIEFLRNFNGINSIYDISIINQDVPIHQIKKLAAVLINNYILIEQNKEYPEHLTSDYYRLINILEDYFHSTSDVINSINRIRKSTVMIVGLGAVGSYICIYLAKIGVTSFILVDPDIVEFSNLHRQCYIESDLGHPKTIKMRDIILKINPEASICTIEKPLNEKFFSENKVGSDINLIINCADEPSVDFTSHLISEFCMKYNIPHIVGGGYNLHLTLIGQTIIPYKTACFKCFDIALDSINKSELKNIKRLHRENRKLGSFSPLSGMAASLAALDAFKLLAGANEFLQQANRRVEFNIRKNIFNIIDIPKNNDCSWCGDK